MKPFDYSYYQEVLRRSGTVAAIGLGLSLVCLGSIVVTKSHKEGLAWLLTGTGVAGTVAARSSLKTREATQLVLNDYNDLSDQVRTNVEFKALAEPVVKPAPVLHEYNWNMLVATRLPVCIQGDREPSLHLAEWIAWHSKGQSIYVSEKPGDIKVGQSLVPGKDKHGSLTDILSYSANPDYQCTLRALDDHKAYRKSDSNVREPLTVIMDSPPDAPDAQGASDLGIHYIILGKTYANWVTVLIGQEAVNYARQRPQNPMMSEALRRWDTGVTPVLVDGQYAKLPTI